MSGPGNIRFERLTGAVQSDHLRDLAGLRIAVFRDFPYLYDGSAEYEARYLAVYAATPDSVIVGAFDGARLVGAATGLPLAAETDGLRTPFLQHGFDPERIFYFGESVLLEPYRGRGLGVAFFEHREAHARALGRFTHCAFCSVIRAADHPRRPPDYTPLDGFWERRGYRPVPSLVGTICWRDRDEEAETAKPMQFWMKAL